MTGVIILKVAAVSAVDGALVTLALVDPSVTNLISVGVGAVVTIVMGWFALKATLASLNKKVDANTDKLDQTLRKTDVIATHVNSEKTEAAGKLAMSERENAMLREMLVEKKVTAALLAQAQAAAVPQPLAVVLPVLPSAPSAAKEPATLKEIEKHTMDTANNTAKTDATVQEIKEGQP